MIYRRSTFEDIVDKSVCETYADQIDTKLLERFERTTGHQPHRHLLRCIVSCDRDLDGILEKFERGVPFCSVIGPGPSSDSLHIGNSVPFEFTK